MSTYTHFSASPSDFAALLAAAAEINGSTLLDLGGGNQLPLYEVPLASLQSSDFMFALAGRSREGIAHVPRGSAV